MRPMTAILCVAAAGVISTLGQQTRCLLCVLAGPEGPHLQLTATEFDLGTIAHGEARHVRVPLSNTGDRRLIVRREGAGCCGNRADPPVIVPPGRTGELVVELDTTGDGGTLRQATGYTTSDPALPRFEVTLVAEVTGAVPGDAP